MNTIAHLHTETGRIILPKRARHPQHYVNGKRVASHVIDGRMAFGLQLHSLIRLQDARLMQGVAEAECKAAAPVAATTRRSHEEMAGTVQFVKDLVGALILAAIGYLAFTLAFAL